MAKHMTLHNAADVIPVTNDVKSWYNMTSWNQAEFEGCHPNTEGRVQRKYKYHTLDIKRCHFRGRACSEEVVLIDNTYTFMASWP